MLDTGIAYDLARASFSWDLSLRPIWPNLNTKA
jgi:hypothetical protein